MLNSDESLPAMVEVAMPPARADEAAKASGANLSFSKPLLISSKQKIQPHAFIIPPEAFLHRQVNDLRNRCDRDTTRV